MKILVCDDSKAMRLIVSRTLRQADLGDHEIVEATNGAEGLEAVRSHAPGLILSDWNMPTMTGIEFLEALKAEDYRGKFCFVTSESNEDMRARAFNGGAVGFITKPFTPEAFRAALSAILT